MHPGRPPCVPPREAPAAPGRPTRPGTARGGGRRAAAARSSRRPVANAATIIDAAPTLWIASPKGTLAGSAARIALVDNGRSGMNRAATRSSGGSMRTARASPLAWLTTTKPPSTAAAALSAWPSAWHASTSIRSGRQGAHPRARPRRAAPPPSRTPTSPSPRASGIRLSIVTRRASTPGSCPSCAEAQPKRPGEAVGPRAVERSRAFAADRQLQLARPAHRPPRRSSGSTARARAPGCRSRRQGWRSWPGHRRSRTCGPGHPGRPPAGPQHPAAGDDSSAAALTSRAPCGRP